MNKLVYFLMSIIWASVGLCQTPVNKVNAPAENLSNPATAIFVTNTAGQQYEQYLPSIKDSLSALLTQKGFAIVRTENALLPDGVRDSNESKQTSVYSEASLNRLAEILRARLLIVATVNNVTHEDRVFNGENTAMKTSYKATIDSVRINLQIYDLGTTKSLYGDTVSFSTRNPVYGADETNNILKLLFHDSTVKIADNIASKVGILNASSTDIEKSTFYIESNVNDVDVFIDGMVIGSTGKKTKFEVTPGIHQLKLGKEMLKSWEKTVNITDGATFSAQMELSPEGLKRYKDISTFNLQMKAANSAIEITEGLANTATKVILQQSEAEAEAKKDIAKGERVKRENSYIHDDGFVGNLEKLIK